MHTRIRSVWVFVVGIALASAAPAAPRPEYGKVELVMDTWGIPHAMSAPSSRSGG